MIWRAACGVDGSTWKVELGENPAPAGSFCPDCQERGSTTPGVLNWVADKMELKDIVGRQVPYKVRYSRRRTPITVVGYGDAGLAPLTSGVRNTTAIFEGGGWLWLPDLLRYYEIVE